MFRERPDVERLARRLIEHEDIATFVEVDEEIFAVMLDRHDFVGGIVIPRVVRHFLIMPLEISGLTFDGQDRRGIKVVADTTVREEVGSRVAGAD